MKPNHQHLKKFKKLPSQWQQWIKAPTSEYIQNRLSRRLLSFGESWRCNPTSGSCCTRTKFMPKCILKFIGHLTEIWYSSISIYIPTGTVSGLKCICCALFISQFLVDQHGLSNAWMKDLTENQERAAKNKRPPEATSVPKNPFPVFLDASELLMYKILHQQKMGETPGTYTQHIGARDFVRQPNQTLPQTVVNYSCSRKFGLTSQDQSRKMHRLWPSKGVQFYMETSRLASSCSFWSIQLYSRHNINDDV